LELHKTRIRNRISGSWSF